MQTEVVQCVQYHYELHIDISLGAQGAEKNAMDVKRST